MSFRVQKEVKLLGNNRIWEVLIFTRFIMIWGRSSNSVIVAVAEFHAEKMEPAVSSSHHPKSFCCCLPGVLSNMTEEIGLYAKNHHEKSILACMCTYILMYHHVLNTHCWVIILVFSRLWIFKAQIAFLETVRILCQNAILFFLILL